MEEKIQLEVVTPYGPVLRKKVDEVVAQSTEGEFGVLPGHAPFITSLEIGMLTYKNGPTVEHMFINSGYAHIEAGTLSVIANSAEKVEDINIERAKEAKKRAEERLKSAESIDTNWIEAALKRATTRIQIVSGPGSPK